MKNINAKIIFDRQFPTRIIAVIVKNRRYGVTGNGNIIDENKKQTNMKIFAVDYRKETAELFIPDEQIA